MINSGQKNGQSTKIVRMYMRYKLRKMCSQTGARMLDPSLTGRVYRLSYPAAWHIISAIETKSLQSHTLPQILNQSSNFRGKFSLQGMLD